MECPLIPMGAVTGRPERPFIRQRLAEFRRAGITQYLIYPRSGCELEYMSGEWLDTCETIVEEAVSLGFTSLWLYDEYNWPSGQCGGKVQASDPDFALKTLVAAPGGEFRVESSPNYPDLLNPRAVELFLELTHERYAARLGSYFGTVIKGIFTDEPSPGYAGGYCDESRNGARLLSYYPGLEEEYERETGVPMRRDLGSARFTETHHKLVGRRFRTVFFDRLRAWCDSHGLLLTGHLMGEQPVAGAKRFSGDPLLAIGGFSLPGLDEIGTKTGSGEIEWLTFGTARYGIEQRGNGGLAELFALGPADLPPAKLRQMITLAGLFGVDRYVLAVSQLDFRGNAGKPDWFNPCSADQPWFASMELLAEDSKTAAELARRTPAPELAVRYPADESDLVPLLRTLVRAQRPWRLIAAGGEAPEDAPEILRPSARGILFERSGESVPSPEEAAALLDRLLPRRVRVENSDGSLAGDLLVKCHADGSVAVLDLSGGGPRELRLRRNGGTCPFTLYGRGRALFPGWRVERDRPNIMRPMLQAKQFRFTVEEPLAHVTPVLREYHDPAAITLDGVPVAAEGPAAMLPPGFAALYRSGTPLRLEAGEHVLELSQGEDNLPYLPAVWLLGDFGFLPPDRLIPDRRDGRGLASFAGGLTQCGTLGIPVDAAGFDLECDGMAAEVFLDGESLGKRLWPPFFWSIPERFRGKPAEWRIVRQTSIGPVFGDLRSVDAQRPDWTKGFTPGAYPLRHPVTEPAFRLL
ncbi:MAG: hypothetical protein HPZ91_16390 [Lentisphaeria bacterium]|nr:hypothetical protein [Lentisphaeria bacterium]